MFWEVCVGKNFGCCICELIGKGEKGDAVMSLSTVVYHQPGKAIDFCFHCSLFVTMFIYEVNLFFPLNHCTQPMICDCFVSLVISKSHETNSE